MYICNMCCHNPLKELRSTKNWNYIFIHYTQSITFCYLKPDSIKWFLLFTTYEVIWIDHLPLIHYTQSITYHYLKPDSIIQIFFVHNIWSHFDCLSPLNTLYTKYITNLYCSPPMKWFGLIFFSPWYIIHKV